VLYRRLKTVGLLVKATDIGLQASRKYNC